jgi:hypothetical protein
MKQQRRHCRAEEKAKSSLEAIRCQQRSTLKKRNAPEKQQKRACCGSDRVAGIVVAWRSWRELLCAKLSPNPTQEQFTKFCEHLSQSC